MRLLASKPTGRPAAPMLGQRFGRLTVLERVENHARIDRPTYRCVCDCGAELVKYGGPLRNGSTKSCGCLVRDRMGQLRRTHGKSKTQAYMMFYDARKRAVKFGVPFEITPEDIEIPEMCPVLGIRLAAGERRDNAPSLDRIVPARGYVPKNVRVISFRANRLKSDASVAEMKAVLEYMEGKR